MFRLTNSKKNRREEKKKKQRNDTKTCTYAQEAKKNHELVKWPHPCFYLFI